MLMENNGKRNRPRRKRKLKKKYLIRRIAFVVGLVLILILLTRSCHRKKLNDDNKNKLTTENNISTNNSTNSLTQDENSNANTTEADNNSSGIDLDNKNITVTDINIEFGNSYTDQGISKENRTLYVVNDNKTKGRICNLLKTSIEGQIPESFAKDENTDAYMDISLNANEHLLVRSNDLYKTEYENINGLYRYVYLVDKSLESQGEIKTIFLTKTNLIEDMEKLLKENNIEGHEMEIGQ